MIPNVNPKSERIGVWWRMVFGVLLAVLGIQLIRLGVKIYCLMT